MFGIGGFELFIILLFGFLIFGPDKLPEMAKTLGAALRKFKQAQAEMESVIKGEVLDVDGTQAKKASSASSSSSAKAKPAPTVTQESFAERKARYDKERAERKAREEKEAIAANRRAMKDEAAQNARNSAAQKKAVSFKSEQASKFEQASPKPSLTPEELFGAKPIQNKPAPKSAKSASEVAPQSQAATSGTAAQSPQPHKSQVVSSTTKSAAPAAVSERGE